MLCGNGPIKVYILKYISIYLEEPTIFVGKVFGRKTHH